MAKCLFCRSGRSPLLSLADSCSVCLRGWLAAARTGVAGLFLGCPRQGCLRVRRPSCCRRCPTLGALSFLVSGYYRGRRARWAHLRYVVPLLLLSWLINLCRPSAAGWSSGYSARLAPLLRSLTFYPLAVTLSLTFTVSRSCWHERWFDLALVPPDNIRQVCSAVLLKGSLPPRGHCLDGRSRANCCISRLNLLRRAA